MPSNTEIERQRNVKSVSHNLKDLAELHGADLEYVLEKRVETLKAEEAKLINQAGAERQIEYILDTYGPAMVQRAVEDVETEIKDNASKGMVECCVCREIEFQERAKPRASQGHICERCSKED